MNTHTFLIRWILYCVLLVIIMPSIIMPAQKNTHELSTEHESEQLSIELSFHRTKTSIKDWFTFDIKLINNGKEKLTVAHRLSFGYFAGLLLVAKDQTGEIVPSDVYFHIPPPRHGSSSYVPLFPNHYLGATLREKAVDVFVKPGRYDVFAVYVNYTSESYAEERFGVKKLWGRERLPIESSPVRIEVTR